MESGWEISLLLGGGWAGRYQPHVDRYNPLPYVAVDTKWLRAFLENQKHDYDRTVKSWRDRGWLEHEPKKLTRQVPVHGRNVRSVKVTCTELVDAVRADWLDNSQNL